jgi:hypothetical protein
MVEMPPRNMIIVTLERGLLKLISLPIYTQRLRLSFSAYPCLIDQRFREQTKRVFLYPALSLLLCCHG